MIRPLATTESFPPVASLTYETALCTELPAFDPVPTLRSVILKPSHLERFEVFLRKTGWLIMPIYSSGLLLRIVVCSVPAPLGRWLAPWAALLHLPPCIVFTAGIRTEYVKFILSAFDFWFPFAVNVVFMVVFSLVLGDLRVLPVVAVWMAFSCSFLQEAYFRDSRNIALAAFIEAFLLLMLLGSVLLNTLDEVHHFNLIVANGHILSTKGVLVNVIGTMIMLMFRTTYRRLRLMRRQMKMKGTAIKSLGYRCFIALCPSGSQIIPPNSIAPFPLGPTMMPYPISKSGRVPKKTTPIGTIRPNSRRRSSHYMPPLQIYLVKDARRYDPRDTLWQSLGSVEPLKVWPARMLQLCGVVGFLLTIPSILIPSFRMESTLLGTVCFGSTAIFYVVNLSCYQKILIKRVMLSFDFLFLESQLLTAHLCLADILSWQWSSTCGVASRCLWAQWSLMIDALTPIMRQRLHIKSWMPTSCIILFITIHLVILLDVLSWNFF